MSSLGSRWLWRGNLKKFPSVPFISLQALRRSCRSKVQSARVREHWLEVMEVCLSLPWEIPTKWKASLRFSSCILYCGCLENMHHSSSTCKTSPWRSPSHLWTVCEFKNWSCNVVILYFTGQQNASSSQWCTQTESNAVPGHLQSSDPLNQGKRQIREYFETIVFMVFAMAPILWSKTSPLSFNLSAIWASLFFWH